MPSGQPHELDPVELARDAGVFSVGIHPFRSARLLDRVMNVDTCLRHIETA